MVFSSLTFLLYFLPAVLLCYFLAKPLRLKNAVLLVFSLIFYAWGRPVWLLGLLFSTLVNYICAIKLAPLKGRGRKIWLSTGLTVSLGLLFVFKYLAFFANTFLGLAGVEMSPLELPIGISFYTFQVLTYTIDVYRGRQTPQRNFARLLLYVSCFPQLIAGPIVQYSDVAAEIDSRVTRPRDFSDGFIRFCVGLGKKALVANLCAEIIDKLPQAPEGALSLGGAWYFALIYALQIYFDFSGYSDMAIGMGRIFGFHYKENFIYPYWASSVRDFWRRWHISLGSFFREYVYIPLGGNRRGLKRTVLNTLIVWGLTGMWHGANLTFIAWGLYYGVILTVGLFFRGKFRLPSLISKPLTFLAVLAGWVMFYYPSLPQAITHLSAMLNVNVPLIDSVSLTVIKQYSFLPGAFLLMSLPLGQLLKKAEEKLPEELTQPVKSLGAAAILALSVVFIVGLSSNPFIYFQF
ncbi:MAG: MBOAT family protein [Clostridiales bacterium]|nr:MBOAT family protein [Clostridiales bacterium]